MSLLSSYQDLITSQHRGKPKYMATVTALLKYSDDIFATAIYIDDEFDLDLADGNQEDVLGVIVGADRTLPFQPEKGLSPILDNGAYKTLIRSQIAKNLWRGGIQDLKDAWQTLFEKALIIQDNQNMTIDVVAVGFNDQIIKDMIQNGMIIPKPQSVGVTYWFSDDAVFGYDMETDTIKGYDESNWQDPEPYVSYAYDKEDTEEGLVGYDEGYYT